MSTVDVLAYILTVAALAGLTMFGLAGLAVAQATRSTRKAGS